MTTAFVMTEDRGRISMFGERCIVAATHASALAYKLMLRSQLAHFKGEGTLDAGAVLQLDGEPMLVSPKDGTALARQLFEVCAQFCDR